MLLGLRSFVLPAKKMKANEVLVQLLPRGLREVQKSVNDGHDDKGMLSRFKYVVC